MGVHMDQGDRPVQLLHGAQDRQGQGVVAAQGQRNGAGRQDGIEAVFDKADGLLQVEGVDRHVADVGDLQAVEGRRAGRHVVGPEHAGLGADLTRSMPGAGAVRGADVHRHADEAGIQAGGGLLGRQAHHGGRAGEARHGVTAERLVESVGHGSVFPIGLLGRHHDPGRIEPQADPVVAAGTECPEHVPEKCGRFSDKDML